MGEDEAAKDVKTWESVKGGENALNHIIKNIFGLKEIRKLTHQNLGEMPKI